MVYAGNLQPNDVPSLVGVRRSMSAISLKDASSRTETNRRVITSRTVAFTGATSSIADKPAVAGRVPDGFRFTLVDPAGVAGLQEVRSHTFRVLARRLLYQGP